MSPSRLAVTMLAMVAAATPAVGQSVAERVADRLNAIESELIALRHDLHQHPEVSGAEVRTSGLIAARLRDLGFDVRTGVGGHGVVGLLRGGQPGPTVAFRADMDAVPSDFPDPVDYRSLTPGVRHICGHDVHVTVGLGIAEGLAAVREELAGSVMLVFQPAEERATGARDMLADGVFADGTPTAIYAVHTAPLPVGQLGTAPGGMMAGRDLVSVVVRGAGDLTEPVRAVQETIAGVGTVPPAMAMAPAPAGFILVQLIPEAAAGEDASRTVRAQVTTASPDARARARDAILRGVEALRPGDATISVEYRERVMAGVTNDSTLVARANAAIAARLGPGAVVPVEGVPPAFSEDFGAFQDKAPGVMYFLGVSNPEAGTVGMPHTPAYVADDGAILVGVRAMTAVLLDWIGPR